MTVQVSGFRCAIYGERSSADGKTTRFRVQGLGFCILRLAHLRIHRPQAEKNPSLETSELNFSVGSEGTTLRKSRVAQGRPEGVLEG